MKKTFSPLTVSFALALAFLITGCMKEDMGSQPKASTMQQSVFFADETTARPLVTGTVTFNDPQIDSHLYTGFVDGKLATNFPGHYPTTSDGPFPARGPELRAILERGRSEFTIYCSMCHGDAGDGRGMIVMRGMVPPPSYHIDRLRQAPVGHFFDVITNGYGQMFSYSDRISVTDRWAIVAYIRTLQMSQAMPVSQMDGKAASSQREAP